MAEALRDALRASSTMLEPVPAEATSTVDVDELPATELPSSPRTTPGLPRRRWPRTAGLIATAAAAATVLAWWSEADVRSASASPTEVTEAYPDAGGPPASEPTSAPRPAGAARTRRAQPPRIVSRAVPAPTAAVAEETAACSAREEPGSDPDPVTTSIQEILDAVPNRDVAP